MSTDEAQAATAVEEEIAAGKAALRIVRRGRADAMWKEQERRQQVESIRHRRSKEQQFASQMRALDDQEALEAADSHLWADYDNRAFKRREAYLKFTEDLHKRKAGPASRVQGKETKPLHKLRPEGHASGDVWPVQPEVYFLPELHLVGDTVKPRTKQDIWDSQDKRQGKPARRFNRSGGVKVRDPSWPVDEDTADATVDLLGPTRKQLRGFRQADIRQQVAVAEATKRDRANGVSTRMARLPPVSGLGLPPNGMKHSKSSASVTSVVNYGRRAASVTKVAPPPLAMQKSASAGQLFSPSHMSLNTTQPVSPVQQSQMQPMNHNLLYLQHGGTGSSNLDHLMRPTTVTSIASLDVYPGGHRP
jgi:hypothetical protein